MAAEATPSSSSLEDSGVLVDNPNDEMSNSGVFVEKPQPRVIHDNEDDAELLQESILDSRQKRLQQLAADQRSKRSTKQQQGRTHPTANTAKANPFSRFLTAFSVDNHHKRAHDDSTHEPEEEEPPLKHARTSEDYEDDLPSSGHYQDAFSKATNQVLNFVSEVKEKVLENTTSTSVLAVGAAVASLALMTLIRKK